MDWFVVVYLPCFLIGTRFSIDYETRRAAGPLMLTNHEFNLIEQHMYAEGQAYLRHESECEE